MKRSRGAWWVVLGVVAVLLQPGRADAGQVRITIPGVQFSPSSVNVSVGDHVVWVWQAGGHSVTSGTGGTPDGIFNTGVQSTTTNGTNTAFTWKVDRTGTINFFCVPHFSAGMAGVINASASGASVSNFRITEVQYTLTGLDRIEITNLGPAPGNLARYRLAIPGDVEGIPLVSMAVASMARVVIHANQAGTNTATDVFVPLLATLPDAAGSVALYAPNTISGQTALTRADQILDFVQYGAGGQANEATAVAAGLWTAGEFVPTVHDSARSIEFCGTVADHGAAHWAEITTPNFGSNGACADRVGVPDPGAPRDIALLPITPNPATRGATVTFSLAQRARVRLEVLDVQGRVVATIADESFEAGRHSRSIELDRARAYSPGVYFVRLHAGGVRRSQRFAVLD